MPLTVTRRKDTGALTITGRVNYPDGSQLRVRQRAQSNDRHLAEEEAVALEARLLREAWHGERRGVRSFAEAVNSYLAAAPRATGDKARLNRILRALGDVTLAAVDQAAVDRVRGRMLAPDASPATVRRGVIAPIRAVLRHASRRGWCDPPAFEIPRQPAGRTLYLLPHEAELLVAAAAPHLRPLLLFLVGTGARLSEALELEWRDLDLADARAIFWRTKNGKRRIAALPPRAVAALAGLGWREGPVFRWETKRGPRGAPKRITAYAGRDRQGGGQIKSAFAGALRRSGLAVSRPGLAPHDLRHTWASWHYALNRDLLALKIEGGWSSVTLVERYAHLVPSGQAPAIRAFLGLAAVTGAEENRATA